MFSSVIEVTPPYSFDRLLARLQTHPDDALRVDPVTATIRRAYRLQNRPVLATLHFSGDVEQPAVEVTTNEDLSSTEQQELLRKVRHMFSTDVDLTPMYEHMSANPYLQPLVEHFRGLKFLLNADLFESMIRTIISQQLNLPFAASLTHRLLRLAGDTLTDDQGETYLVFPTAEAIARLEVPMLRELQFSQRKAEYIIDFARAVVDRKVELERLWQMTDDEVIAALTPLRGVGRWTVECLLMFGMGRPDLLPAADIGLRNGIMLVYGLSHKPDEKEIRHIGESWAPWRSYVSLYVWEAVGAVRRKEPVTFYHETDKLAQL